MDLARFRLVLDRLGHAPKLTLVGLGEADLPRDPGVVDAGERRGAGAALAAVDGDEVGGAAALAHLARELVGARFA